MSEGWPGWAFVLVALIGMYIGRKLGWRLSRGLDFAATGAQYVIFGVWGILVAATIRTLIHYGDPQWMLRWIFGYAMGAYIAIPMFGLPKHEWYRYMDDIPDYVKIEGVYSRAKIFQAVPVVTYIVASVALALW